MNLSQFRRGPAIQKLDRFWAFIDDSDVTTALDLSANREHGTITDGAYRDGPYGRALHANGTSTEVEITAPTFSSAYTVVAWFTLDSPGDGDEDAIFTARQDNDVFLAERGNDRLRWDHTDTNGDTTVLQTGQSRGENPRAGREYIAVARWDGSTASLHGGSRKDTISPLHLIAEESVDSLRAGGIDREAIASFDGTWYLDGSVSGVALSTEYLNDAEVLWLDAHLNIVKALGMPFEQLAAISALTDNLGDSTTDGTLEAIGDTSSADQSAAIERNLAELDAKIDTLISRLETLGLISE